MLVLVALHIPSHILLLLLFYGEPKHHFTIKHLHCSYAATPCNQLFPALSNFVLNFTLGLDIIHPSVVLVFHTFYSLPWNKKFKLDLFSFYRTYWTLNEGMPYLNFS